MSGIFIEIFGMAISTVLQACIQTHAPAHVQHNTHTRTPGGAKCAPTYSTNNHNFPQCFVADEEMFGPKGNPPNTMYAGESLGNTINKTAKEAPELAGNSTEKTLSDKVTPVQTGGGAVGAPEPDLP